jgi:hypothetical protein
MFGNKSKELVIPPEATTDPKAMELIRVWAAHGVQHVSMSPGVWKDPAIWGIVLVDLARHVANYYHQVHGLNKEDVLLRIKELFNAEWESPTSGVTGNTVE